MSEQTKDVVMRMGEAQQYLLATYGVRWSRAHITRLLRDGTIYGFQDNGTSGWWWISRGSIDELMRRP